MLRAAMGTTLPTWSTLDELGELATKLVGELREERRRTARGLGAVTEAISRAARTDAPEYLDDPSVSEDRKLAIVRALHAQHAKTGAYAQFTRFIGPYASWAHGKSGRPARVLEIAGGSGELSAYLARKGTSGGVPIEVTCTDVVEKCVVDARARAAERGLSLSCERLDASDMRHLGDGAYDVAFVAGSIHHFPPSLLARVIAESTRVAKAGFIAVDGKRGLATALFITGYAALSGPYDFFHDAVISARRFYPEAELDLLGRLAAPGRRVKVASYGGVMTVLEVDRRMDA